MLSDERKSEGIGPTPENFGNSCHLLNEEDFQEAYSAIIPVANGKNMREQLEFDF